MISLAGRWTAVQLKALYRAGWIEPEQHFAVDVTTHRDAVRWYLILKRTTFDALTRRRVPPGWPVDHAVE